jgi:hypothetical protein
MKCDVYEQQTYATCAKMLNFELRIIHYAMQNAPCSARMRDTHMQTGASRCRRRRVKSDDRERE